MIILNGWQDFWYHVVSIDWAQVNIDCYLYSQVKPRKDFKKCSITTFINQNISRHMVILKLFVLQKTSKNKNAFQ